jgi:hypothetical protein
MPVKIQNSGFLEKLIKKKTTFKYFYEMEYYTLNL